MITTGIFVQESLPLVREAGVLRALPVFDLQCVVHGTLSTVMADDHNLELVTRLAGVHSLRFHGTRLLLLDVIRAGEGVW